MNHLNQSPSLPFGNTEACGEEDTWSHSETIVLRWEIIWWVLWEDLVKAKSGRGSLTALPPATRVLLPPGLPLLLNEPLWCLGLSHPRGNLNSMHFKCPIPTEAITVLESSVRDRPLRPRKRSQKWRTSPTRQGQSLFVFSNDTEREGRWGDDLKGQARVHRGETLTGKRADVIFEKTLGLAGLGHKTGECPLHVSSLGRGLLPQDLVVRHRLTVRLKGEQQRH